MPLKSINLSRSGKYGADVKCQKQWITGMDGKRDSRKSVLSMQLDDDNK